MDDLQQLAEAARRSQVRRPARQPVNPRNWTLIAIGVVGILGLGHLVASHKAVVDDEARKEASPPSPEMATAGDLRRQADAARESEPKPPPARAMSPDLYKFLKEREAQGQPPANEWEGSVRRDWADYLAKTHGGKAVYVHGYYRSDGTYVSAHYRSN